MVTLLWFHTYIHTWTFRFDCGSDGGDHDGGGGGGGDGGVDKGSGCSNNISLTLFRHKTFKTQKQILTQLSGWRFGGHRIFHHNSTLCKMSSKHHIAYICQNVGPKCMANGPACVKCYSFYLCSDTQIGWKFCAVHVLLYGVKKHALRRSNEKLHRTAIVHISLALVVSVLPFTPFFPLSSSLHTPIRTHTNAQHFSTTIASNRIWVEIMWGLLLFMVRTRVTHCRGQQTHDILNHWTWHTSLPYALCTQRYGEPNADCVEGHPIMHSRRKSAHTLHT